MLAFGWKLRSGPCHRSYSRTACFSKTGERERSQPFVTSSQEWHPLNVAVFCWLKASYSSGRDYNSVYQEVRLSQAGFEAQSLPPTFRLSLSPLRPSFLFSLPGSFILLMYISVYISHRYLTSVCLSFVYFLLKL